MKIDTANLPDPYQSLNEDGIIIDINDEWSDLLNYGREEVIGKYFGDFLSENEKVLFKKHFEYFKENGSVRDVTFLLRHKDGYYLPCNYDGKISKDESGKLTTQCIFKDHTRFVDYQSKFEEVFDHSPNGIVIYKPYKDGEDFIFIEVNKQVEKIEQVSKEDIIGKRVSEVFPMVKDLPIFEAFQSVYKNGVLEHIPMTVLKLGNKVGYRSNTIIKLPSDKLLVIYVDETEQEYIRRMLDTTMDTIESIVLTTIDGEGLEWCNEYALNTLGYESLKSFKEKHKCICDFFIKDDGLGCIGEEVKGVRWTEYAMNNKNSTVKLHTSEGLRFFSLKVNHLNFDNVNRYVVVMDDISSLKDTIRNLKSTTKNLTISKSELENSFESVMHTFVDIMEEKDVYTAGHSKRVAEYSKNIAIKMKLSDQQIDTIYRAGQLHDIGKIITPESVLLKPSRFNLDEYALMMEHASSGANILSKLNNYDNIARVVRHHHEHYDGTGYPDALKGEDIPILSRIMTIADAFDAMTTNRVYKPRMNIKDAISEIEDCAGTHFDPNIIQFAIEYFSSIGSIENTPSIPTDDMSRHRFAYFFKDNLTNTYNGNYLEVFLTNNEQEKLYISACLFDLHNFHKYNKKHGWQSGNKILVDVANVIRSECNSDMLFRVHGDKFVVLYQEHISNTVSNIFDFLPEDLNVTVEIINDLNNSVDNIDDLMARF